MKKDRKWLILIAMCLLTVILNLDATGLNIAIPVIANEFQAGLASMQWVINAYVLVTAMFQIVGGRLGDMYGHRKIFLIGTALFILSSLGAGISQNETTLIAFRALQGLALGIAYPMTIVLTLAAFPKKQQGFALSFIVATMGISLAIGPPLGGLFVHYLSWRWIFFVNIPIGLISFILAYLFCQPHKTAGAHAIDYKGSVLLILGLFGITLAANQVQNWGFTSPLFLSSLLLGLIFLGLLYFCETHRSYPIIDFKLFKIRNFFINNIVRLIMQLVFIPVLFFMPLYLQNIAGFSPIYSGVLLLFLTIIIGLLSPITGKWVDSVGDRLPNILAMFCSAIACLLFFLLDENPETALLGVGLLLVGISTGITFVSTVTGSVSVASSKQQGVATGIIFTTAWYGCALGIAVIGAILAMTSQSFFLNNSSAISTTFSPEQLSAAGKVVKGISSFKTLPQFFTGDQLQAITSLSKQSFMHGFRISMLSMMGLSLIGLLLSFCLKKHKIDHPVETKPL